jgi:ABC-type transporter Mla subunit MlaD
MEQTLTKTEAAADQVRKAVEQLNHAILNAANVGVSVEVSTDEFRRMDANYPQVNVRLFKVL